MMVDIHRQQPLDQPPGLVLRPFTARLNESKSPCRVLPSSRSSLWARPCCSSVSATRKMSRRSAGSLSRPKKSQACQSRPTSSPYRGTYRYPHPSGRPESAFRHRDPASLDATRHTIAPVPDPYAHQRRPRRRSASGGYALLPARSSGFRHSRARLQEALGRRTHLGGGPHRPLAPVGQPRHAGPGQPRPRPLRASRTGRTRPGTASSSRPRAARHPDRCRRRGRHLHRQLPEPVIGHARRPLHPRRAKSGSPTARQPLQCHRVPPHDCHRSRRAALPKLTANVTAYGAHADMIPGRRWNRNSQILSENNRGGRGRASLDVLHSDCRIRSSASNARRPE